MAEQGVTTTLPRLRFPEFRKMASWPIVPLEEIAERIFTKNSDGQVTRVLTNSAEFGVLDQRDYFDKDIATAGKVDGYYVVSKGDYVYNPRTSAIAPVGPISRNNLGEGVMSPLYTVFCFSEEKTDFYEHYFKSPGWHSYLRSAASTGARHDRMSITAGAFMRMPVPSPSREEQQKIADCLTSLDEVIAAQGRKVEALKVHKRGLMQQLFPLEGETYPRLRFPEFRDAPDWILGKASDIVEILQGYGFPERLQGSREGEFPFYKVSDISACVDAGGILLDEANNHIDTDVLEELRAKLMPVGSTVFAKIGEAIRSNKRAITSRPCLVDNNAAGIKAITGLAHDRFVYYLWCQLSLIEYAGGVVPAVNKSAMAQITVHYPNLDEQQQIADLLSSIDTRIAAESTQLTALKTHKQGLMQQLFPSQGAG
ncbi:restriction endonuclease subunit S [Xanthomonas euvesicatoria]|uniref:restriction endonuclease subunit S n=1 Tax=Xanthomonas euvesicatoria TaxID=456327 RepID=UPI003A0FF25D